MAAMEERYSGRCAAPATAAEVIDSLTLYKRLCDMAAEAGAAGTVIGRPELLERKLIALRDEIGRVTSATIPLAAAPAAPAEPDVWVCSKCFHVSTQPGVGEDDNWCGGCGSCNTMQSRYPAPPAAPAPQPEPVNARMLEALKAIMRAADAAKEPCGADHDSPASIRNGKIAAIASIAAQGLGILSGPPLAAQPHQAFELPELPGAKWAPSLYPVRLPDYCYDEDQMRAYARAAIAAAEAQPVPAPLTEEQHKRLQAHLAQTLAQPGKPVRLDDDIVLALKSFVGMGNPIAPDPGKGYPLDALVDRFLTWPVPADVYPDGTPGQPGRTGTNLLSAPQARAMLEHVLGIGAAGEKGGA